MKFSTVAAPALLATLAAASPASYPAGNDTYVTITQTVSTYTTYCPSSTQITTNNKTYTITSATTLTITDCPCTIITSKPAPPPGTALPPPGTAPAPAPGAPAPAPAPGAPAPAPGAPAPAPGAPKPTPTPYVTGSSPAPSGGAPAPAPAPGGYNGTTPVTPTVSSAVTSRPPQNTGAAANLQPAGAALLAIMAGGAALAL